LLYSANHYKKGRHHTKYGFATTQQTIRKIITTALYYSCILMDASYQQYYEQNIEIQPTQPPHKRRYTHTYSFRNTTRPENNFASHCKEC